MEVVLADVEEGALDAAGRELEAAGAEVLAVRCDVADRRSVDDLADATVSRFGAVHLVCNNAGVSGGVRSGVGDDGQGLGVGRRGQPPRRRARDPGVRATDAGGRGRGPRREHVVGARALERRRVRVLGDQARRHPG
jgi:NAD(P)-dependent dehydrogenase (short-subunit alcohol dehydrogenase family)